MAATAGGVSQGRVPRSALLILVTLGTHEQPFPRALSLLAPLADEEEIVVQHGRTSAPAWCPPSRRFAFLSYERLTELMRAADAVVAHAGVGTIITALALGKVPVLVPRLRRFGEHVDDHQLQIATAFSERGLVELCAGNDLAGPLAQARARAGTRGRPTGDLVEAVAAATRAG